MTIICALRAAEGVWVGSDTLVVGDDDEKLVSGPKWAFHAGWAVACAGEHRLTNLIEANLLHLLGDLGSDDGGAYCFAGLLRDLMRKDRWVDQPGEDQEPGGRPLNFGQDVLLTDGSGVWGISECFDVLARAASPAP